MSRGRSRYERAPLRISWLGVILGIALGVGAGLYYAWEVAPVEEIDIAPWQLRQNDQSAYMAAVALAYSADGDLARAVDRLLLLRPAGDPIQALADNACTLARSGYVDSSGGLNAVRAMMRFYQLQGRSGCADQLIALEGSGGVVVIDLPTPTVTLTPPASKTPTPAVTEATATPIVISVPTVLPQNDFLFAGVSTSCSVEAPGVIRVDVYRRDGVTGYPGREVRVRWDGGESRFFTGLKPGFDPSYSDFVMETGRDYIVDLPNRADPLRQALSAVPCTTPTGERSIISYRVIFREGA